MSGVLDHVWGLEKKIRMSEHAFVVCKDEVIVLSQK